MSASCKHASQRLAQTEDRRLERRGKHGAYQRIPTIQPPKPIEDLFDIEQVSVGSLTSEH